jgi:hypothetical protein
VETAVRIIIKIILGIAGIPFISVEIQLRAALKYLPAEYWFCLDFDPIIE